MLKNSFITLVLFTIVVTTEQIHRGREERQVISGEVAAAFMLAVGAVGFLLASL
jgi:hypothetical protein